MENWSDGVMGPEAILQHSITPTLRFVRARRGNEVSDRSH
jgi:hypothetical protein